MSIQEAIHWLRALVKIERWRNHVSAETVAWIESATDEQLASEPHRTLPLANEGATFAVENDLDFDTSVDAD